MTIQEIIEAWNGCCSDGEGGGGVTMAKVTFSNYTDDSLYIIVPNLKIEDGQARLTGAFNIFNSTSLTVDVPVINGSEVYGYDYEDLGASYSSGDVEITADGFVIRGNGTLVFGSMPPV